MNKGSEDYINFLGLFRNMFKFETEPTIIVVLEDKEVWIKDETWTRVF